MVGWIYWIVSIIHSYKSIHVQNILVCEIQMLTHQVLVFIENFIWNIQQQFNKGIFMEIEQKSDKCDFDVHFPGEWIRKYWHIAPSK